jgi:cyclic pyranopterin phosphate synthase
MTTSVNKADLTDTFGRPLRDLRVSVTDRCNFRCVYCMPAEIYGERYEFLPKPELLTFEEIARLTGILVRFGVKKVRLTGGEPLVRAGIEVLVEMLSNIAAVEDLTLTTNGFLLSQKARVLKEAGLQRVTVSMDTLDEEIFKVMNGRGYGTHQVLKGIDAAALEGFGPIKINAVVKKGVNDHTIVDLARHFKGTGHIVRFIEYMDVGNLNGWNMDHVLSSSEVVERIDAVFPLEPIGSNYFGEVASRYQYRDGTGEIGVISSVTTPFCGQCTRARLSPNGELYTCLFAGNGFDLKTPLREGANDSELTDLVANLWGARNDQYSELRSRFTGSQPKKIEMYQIGG